MAWPCNCSILNSPEGGPIQIFSGSSEGGYGPAYVAFEGDGSFIVEWSYSAPLPNFQHAPTQTFIQSFSASGVPLTSAVPLSSSFIAPTVAADAQGDIAIAYLSGGGPVSGVAVQLLDSGFQPEGGPIQIFSGSSEGGYGPAYVAFEGDGSFIVEWSYSAPLPKTPARTHTNIHSEL